MNEIVTDKSIGERVRDYVERCAARGHKPTVREIGANIGVSSTGSIWRFLPKPWTSSKKARAPKEYIYNIRHFPAPATGYKFCRDCGKEKLLELFTDDRFHADGKRSYCNECQKARHAESYRRNPQPFKDTTKRWVKNNPEKVRAHSRLNEAVRHGRITKPEYCEICGQAKRVEAHHWKGYSDEYVLDVQWLCRACHKKEDKKS